MSQSVKSEKETFLHLRSTVGRKSTRVLYDPIDKDFSVIYHDTRVFMFRPESRVVNLQTGGWLTVTTKRRMQQAFVALDLPIRVYQSKHVWYVETYDQASGETVARKEFRRSAFINLKTNKIQTT